VIFKEKKDIVKKGVCMKLRKKIKRYISFIVVIMIFIQPFFLQSQLIAAQRHYQDSLEENVNSLHENQVSQKSEYFDPKFYIDITPEKLDGLNLKELLRIIIEYAYETNTLHKLPQGLINCCKALENEESTLYMPDLVDALPIVIALLTNPSIHSKLSRAPRLDAHGTDNAVVGPVVNCDLDKVVQLLNKLFKTINECCAELEFDFNGVFTVLSHLVATATCDLSLAFSIINTNFDNTFTELSDIKNSLTACCDQLEFDFDGTFSILVDLATTITCDFISVFSVINANFDGTFTVLNDIKDTLTLCCGNLQFNFDGTFTVLENVMLTATCDLTSIFSVLNTSFNGTFTELTDIKDTLTTCCNNLQFNFDGTFTVFENVVLTATCDFTSVFTAVNASFDGTFTALQDIKNTLTTCCTALESNFDATFTVLAHLTNFVESVTCDFTSVFSVLVTNFNGTFSILQDIKDTLTTCCITLESGFEGTFTELANLETTVTCNLAPLFIVLTANFNGTFTVLEDIKDTLTICCAQLESDFDSTFSVISNLVVTATCDFTALSTGITDIKNSLTTCCAELEFDFDSTFTALENVVATATCDFTPIFTILSDIKNTLTICFNFNNTFTTIIDIKNSLTACCAELEFGFDGTFTALANLSRALCDVNNAFTIATDIKNTLTLCCAELESNFEGTFTALANIHTTAIVDLASVFTIVNDIKNTLTMCCTEIQQDFDGTFSSLAKIKASSVRDISGTFSVLGVLTADICNPKVIRQRDFGVGGATPLTISTPGVYIFGENITFSPAGASQAIIITTSAVIVDLGCFILNQGNSTAGVDAIRVNSNLSDVTIKNGTITNFTRAGISVQDNSVRTMIQNVTCVLCAVRGIELLSVIGNSTQDAEIDHCTVNACAQGVTGDFGILLQRGSRCKISYCDVVDCGSAANTLSAIRLDTCDQTNLNIINVFENSATTLVGIQLLGSTRSSFKKCIIRSNAATTNLTGFGFAGATNRFNMFNDCQIVRNTTGATFIGVNLPANTNNNIFVNCNISWNTGLSSAGFSLTGGAATNNQNSFIECVISANSSTTGNCVGFAINGSDADTILNSVLAYNTSSGALAIGINFSGAGGSFWTVKDSLIARNIGINAASSFGVLLGAGTNDFITGNFGYGNGGVGALPANQFSGVANTSVNTPPSPATDFMNSSGRQWDNAAIAV
jgi:hypothetical protein